jgi:putative transposase
MPRRPRIAMGGEPLHIIQRGNNRHACCFCTDDHRVAPERLAQYAAGLGCAVHACVLMTDPVHLLLTPAAPDSPARLVKRSHKNLVRPLTSNEGASSSRA